MEARTVPVVWNGMTVEAADPARIARWVPEMSARVVRRTERAAGAVERFGDRTLGVAEIAARLLLRAEGLASSAIEGLRASAADVALAQAVGARPETAVAAWVADNLAVVDQSLATPAPLAVADLLGWHRRLMVHSPTMAEAHVGAWRDTLGWVGGPNPRLAAHVAAPAENIVGLMDDLVAFVARDDLDAVTQAAVAHAQFETIHPFADGNGRIGRVLIGWILSNRLGVRVPPPVSLPIARSVGGYQAGLTLYRQGHVDAWVEWFADAVLAAAEDSAAVLVRIGEVQDAWRAATADLRADSAARRLVEVLPSHPVLSSATVAALTGVSDEAGRLALDALTARGVLTDVGRFSTSPGRPRRWWAAHGILDLLGRAR
jgi:Fic family protein